MVRPCVASGFAELAVSGLASMYPAFDWSICSGPSWISARVRSHYRTGLDWTIWVTSVRTRSEDRSSISSGPLADLGWKLLIGLRHRLLLISRSSFVRAKGRSFVQHRPGDAGKLVGERDRQHVVVQPPLGGFDPGFEPITFPVLYPDQHNPCRLHKQNAQVAIAAPRDFAEDRAVSRRDLLGHQSEPGAEVAAFGEYVSSADRGHHGARNDRPDARHRHQARTCLILTGQCFDLAG